jgi:hypothetical protein
MLGEEKKPGQSTYFWVSLWLTSLFTVYNCRERSTFFVVVVLVFKTKTKKPSNLVNNDLPNQQRLI